MKLSRETAEKVLIAGVNPYFLEKGKVWFEEKLILEALKEGGVYIDKIIERTKLDPATVSSILATMEIKGKIRNLGGNMYGISNC